ncbi:MAG: hypothetical protein ACRDB0_05365 [Paraclostridium sp.]
MPIRRLISIDLNIGDTKIGIVDSFLRYKNMKYLKSINTEELSLLDSNHIKCLSKDIKNYISKYRIPFMGVIFTLQNETIINRNIKIIKPQDENDITDLIKYELRKFMTIDLESYIIRFVINSVDDLEMEVQAILFPKSSIEICKEIAKIINIKPKQIYVNFNVLQNLIYKNILNIENGENLILEVKQDIVNLNVVKDKQIIESYSISKNNELNRYIESKLHNINKIYIYGINDEKIVKMINNIVQIEKLEICNLNIKNKNNYNLNEYINNIVMIF